LWIVTWSFELGTRNCLAAAGKDGFVFLKDGPGVRQSGMGDSAVSVADDVNGAFWNPAGFAEVRSDQASFAYSSEALSMTRQSLSFARPSDFGGWGVSLQRGDSGNIQGYDTGDAKTSNFNVGDESASFGLAGRRGLSTSYGATVKYVSQKISDVSASAYAADLGVLQRLTWNGRPLPFSAGLAVRNVGSKASFDGEKTSLPQSVDAGMDFHGFSEAVTVAAEVHKPQDGHSYFSAGGEMWLRGAMAIRAGYDGGTDLGNGFHVGVGFKLKGIQIDYAWTAMGNGFGNVHRFGLLFRFGRPGDQAYEEGCRLSQQGNYPEAILKFEKALDADPGHIRAIQGLRDAVKRLENETGSAPSKEGAR
jgi:hypothetical protein